MKNLTKIKGRRRKGRVCSNITCMIHMHKPTIRRRGGLPLDCVPPLDNHNHNERTKTIENKMKKTIKTHLFKIKCWAYHVKDLFLIIV